MGNEKYLEKYTATVLYTLILMRQRKHLLMKASICIWKFLYSACGLCAANWIEVSYAQSAMLAASVRGMLYMLNNDNKVYCLEDNVRAHAKKSIAKTWVYEMYNSGIKSKMN